MDSGTCTIQVILQHYKCTHMATILSSIRKFYCPSDFPVMCYLHYSYFYSTIISASMPKNRSRKFTLVQLLCGSVQHINIPRVSGRRMGNIWSWPKTLEISLWNSSTSYGGSECFLLINHTQISLMIGIAYQPLSIKETRFWISDKEKLQYIN